MKLDNINIKLPGSDDISLPSMLLVKQKFPRTSIPSIGQAVEQTLAALPRLPDLTGKRIAITAGSRGCAHALSIYRTLVERLRARGAEPFLIPSMGSHGGATAEGQKGLLAGYGITEENVGAPILSSMEVVRTAKFADGVSLYCDRVASEADGIVILNKIKPHTNFKGDYESGLCKMMVIGLGKHKGATEFHFLGFGRFAEDLPKAAASQLRALPILFGLGYVENAYDELAVLEAIPPERILEREKELLVVAKDVMGKLLMSSIDILVIDEIGKNISGHGMDPTVTGRTSTGLPGFVSLPIRQMIVRDITAESHGNGGGMGVADLITLRVFNKLDLGMTYTNSITSRNVAAVRIPVIANSDRQALTIAMQTSFVTEPSLARIVRIRNTKELQTIQMSTAYLEEIVKDPDSFDALGDAYPFEFDADGNLIN